MKQIALILLGLFLIFVTSRAQEVGAADRLADQLALYPQEKLYVHTDKDAYMAGDTLWLRAHVADASTHMPVAASKYVYVEFLSAAKPASGEQPPAPLHIRILEKDGVYAGYIPLPMTAQSGDYTLTAYTAFMRNLGPDYFYRTNIHVGAYGSPYAKESQRRSEERGYEVAFFPEGGYLIEGVPCCVGFKALKGDGSSAYVKGRIVDDTGAEIVPFESLYAGMGILRFTPQPGRSYAAECTNITGQTRRYRMPAVRTDACALQVFPTSERFTVAVAQGAACDPGQLALLIHCRGEVCYSEKWKPGGHATFKRRDFPDGVLQILLLDQDNNALSERLLFCCNPKRQPKVKILPDKSAYGRREKVQLRTEFRDAKGKPLSGSFSVAVTDNRIIDPLRESDIRTALLLESELRGYIENPAFYFDERESSRYAAVDALMLTQGWRRYDAPKVLQGQYTEPAEPLEIGQEITGRIRKTGLFRKRNFRDYQVSMIAPGRNVFMSALVDSAGWFSLNGFDLPDSTLCVLRAFGPNGREDVELLIDEERYPNLQKPIPIPDLTARMRGFNENRRLFTDSLKSILLDEIVISAAARKVPATPQEVLASGSFDYKEIEKEKYNSLEEALQRQHGVSIRLGYAYIFQKAAAYIIDGILWEPLDLMDGLADKMPNHIPMDIIKRIDIIPPVNTTLYGSRVGDRGVVYITTKTGAEMLSTKREDLDHLNIKVVDPLGFQRPVEFYSPVYDTPKRWNAHERDLRTTLYWNPVLRVENGKATMEFYTGDEGSDYTVTLEGVTPDGTVVHAQAGM